VQKDILVAIHLSRCLLQSFSAPPSHPKVQSGEDPPQNALQQLFLLLVLYIEKLRRKRRLRCVLQITLYAVNALYLSRGMHHFGNANGVKVEVLC
jgi:hypothetical protein